MKIFCNLLVGASVVSLLCGYASAEKVKPLFAHDLPNVAGKVLTTVEVDFAPGAKADPHRHGQAFVYAYVLEGSVRSQLGGEPARTYHVGESWFEPSGADHVLTQNMSSKKPARLLVVFVSNAGEPLRSAEPVIEENHAMPAVATPTAAIATSQPAPQQMVNTLYSAFGDNHSRAVHAKGIMAMGTFEPSADAADRSQAFRRQIHGGHSKVFKLHRNSHHSRHCRECKPTRPRPEVQSSGWLF